MAIAGELSIVERDACDIALGHRFAPEERRSARIHLTLVYAQTRGPMADLLADLHRWAALHSFDDDQDPGSDTPDQRLVRAYGRFAAIQLVH